MLALAPLSVVRDYTIIDVTDGHEDALGYAKRLKAACAPRHLPRRSLTKRSNSSKSAVAINASALDQIPKPNATSTQIAAAPKAPSSIRAMLAKEMAGNARAGAGWLDIDRGKAGSRTA